MAETFSGPQVAYTEWGSGEMNVTAEFGVLHR